MALTINSYSILSFSCYFNFFVYISFICGTIFSISSPYVYLLSANFEIHRDSCDI